MTFSSGSDLSISRKSDPEFDEIVTAIAEEVLNYLVGVPAGESPLTEGPPDNRRPRDDQRLVIGGGADRISVVPPLAEIDAGIAAQIASLIDHTLLRPEASRSDIEKLCAEAVRFGFASVCINPWYVPLAVELVRGSAVKVCTVVGFPLGATLPRVKIYEAEEAIKLGAREIDMVQNIGALKSGEDAQVESDIRGVVEASHRGGAICKVILETALLTASEKVRASLTAKRAGAPWGEGRRELLDTPALRADPGQQERRARHQLPGAREVLGRSEQFSAGADPCNPAVGRAEGAVLDRAVAAALRRHRREPRIDPQPVVRRHLTAACCRRREWCGSRSLRARSRRGSGLR